MKKSEAQIQKKKKPTVSKLKKKLDAIFSKYIRLSNAFVHEGELSCVCVTCGNTKPVKKMQNGHFMSRQHTATRYNELNCSPQCYGCNVMQQGKQYEHGLYLDKKHGAGTASDMYVMSKISKPFKPFELDEMIVDYSKRVDDLNIALSEI